jgi:BolA family transcriptional regulator, general stress-responsive regulator
VNIAEKLRERLSTLHPEMLEIVDESSKHVGHVGAASGGRHYQVIIVAQSFAGKSPVARHRLVYDAVGDLMRQEVHALAIQAFAPDEPRSKSLS